MASQLLQTATTTFLELVGNGRRLVVPRFQRDYSWDRDQWEDLWEDIESLQNETEDVHYMGALVFQRTDDRVLRVIDGQQRLATLTLLALAVVDAIGRLVDDGREPEENDERKERARRLYVGDKDPTSLTYASKLTLNRTDNDFFQTYLVQLRTPPNPNGLPPSNRLLWRAFTFFQERLTKLPEARRTGRGLAELLNEIVARRLLFITVFVENELSAYTVFETLNARGLELTASDLLKNHLFGLLTGSELDQERLETVWARLVLTVGQERLPDFLRYYLLLDQTRVRARRLFEELRARVPTASKVFDFVADLETYAELFAALGDPNHEYWQEQPEQRRWIRELVVLRARPAFPLFFACHRVFDTADFARLLKLVVSITLRHTIAKRPTNALEPAYAAAAIEVRAGRAPRPGHVAAALRGIYVGDDEFKSAFTGAVMTTAGPGRRQARYVLARLESRASGRGVDFETDPFTIEHVLPTNPGSEWLAQFPKPEAWIDRIGNLVPLEGAKNRDCGSADFAAKKVIYESSAYVLAHGPVEIEEWSPAAVERRQQQLAEQAAIVWRSDFDTP